MTRLIATASLMLAFASSASAQTLPQPSLPNNTVLCFSINSTTLIAGQLQDCVGFDDTGASDLLEAYAQKCMIVGAPQMFPRKPCSQEQAVKFMFHQLQETVVTYIEGRLVSKTTSAVARPVMTPMK